MVAAEGEILPRLALIDNTFQQKQKSSQKKNKDECNVLPKSMCWAPLTFFLVSWKEFNDKEYSNNESTSKENDWKGRNESHQDPNQSRLCLYAKKKEISS